MNVALDKNFILILGMICILSTFSFNFVFAQNQDSRVNEQEIIQELNNLDGLLTTPVAATLAGLSLAGASFLVRAPTNDSNKIFLERATKNFVISFLFFLSCLISIFVFDTIETIFPSSVLIVEFDTVITYGLFGIGCFTLVRSAKGIYSSFVHN